MKRISFPDIEIKVHDIPPANVQIGSADDKTLARYGLPIAKTDVEKAMLADVMQRLSGRLRFVTPEFSLRSPRDSRHRGGHRDPKRAIEQDLGNWAGTAAEVSVPSQSFQWIKAEFMVPNLAGTTASTAGHSSHWIGFDGYVEGNPSSSNQVCQCGVDCDNTPKKDLTTPYLWVQWFPGPLVQLTSKDFPVSPGDTLLVMLCATGKGAIVATASFVNLTTGVGFAPVEFSPPAGISLFGESAEWISERPGYDIGNGSIAPFPLGNFGSCTFFNAYAGVLDEAGDRYVQDGSMGDQIKMNSTNLPIHLLCNVSVATPGVITTTWVAQE